MNVLTVRFFLATALLLTNVSWASPTEDPPPGFRGPVLGYVLDRNAASIRPLNGILGSSALGQPLALPFPVSAAAFSPRSDYALAVSASDNQGAYVLHHLGGKVHVREIPDALQGADRIVLNPDASVGVLLASNARQLQIVRGVPTSPAAEPPLDLSSIPGTISAVAIGGSASTVLLGVSSDHGALYMVPADGQNRPRLIAIFGSPTALALLSDDRDVIVSDAAVDEITLIRNFADEPRFFRLATERDGISGPVGLLVSAEGQRLYIVNGRSRRLATWNFETQSIEASHELPGHPTGLTAFQGSSTYLLNNVGDHSLLLLDAAGTPMVYFVPPVKDRQ